MDLLPLIATCSLLTVALAAGLVLVSARASSEESRFGVLYDAEGAAETYANCTPCHSELIIAQQGLSRRRWDELRNGMVREQGMIEIQEPVRTRILNYLAQHYGEDRPNFPKR